MSENVAAPRPKSLRTSSGTPTIHVPEEMVTATARTPLTLGDLAALTDAAVRGWVHYYGAFYRSACLQILQHLNRALARWAHRKFKALRRRPLVVALGWLRRLALRDPSALALWQCGVLPSVRL